MTSPMVENFSVPVFMALDDDETGFPFDREERDNSFQTQLDDLAKRHPEFAQHLNPAGWGARPRRTSGSGQQEAPSASHEFPTRSRFRESPFGSRTFDQFFPFDREFEDPVYYDRDQPNNSQQNSSQPPQQQQPPQNSTQNQQQSQQPHNVQQPQVPDNTQKPPPCPTAPQERSRRQQNSNNIQQSNTVDLGQKQEPVDSDTRNQRSMSAPPENRSGKRFISSVNIPNLNPGPAGDMGTRMSQPEPTAQQQQNKPNERIIPIHIEGRDEPVIPTNVNATYRQPSPQREQIFGQNKDFYKQFFDNQQQGPSQEELQKAELLKQQQQYQKQQQEAFQRQKEAEDVPPPPPPQVPASKPTPLDQIQLIQKDVSALMLDVENFDGKPRDKRYIYLDEMLTLNLLKLDNIETEGKDAIRQARREAIKCIEKYTSLLEAIAERNENASKQETTEIVKPDEATSEVPMELETAAPAKEASPKPMKEPSPAPPTTEEKVETKSEAPTEKGEGDKPSQVEAALPERPEDVKEKKKTKKKGDSK